MYLFATSTREGHSCLVQECYVVLSRNTPTRVNSTFTLQFFIKKLCCSIYSNLETLAAAFGQRFAAVASGREARFF
jgi:hypothetical protein